MSAIILDVNYVPIVVNNWPKGFSGYICGTIPSTDASCSTGAGSSLRNIGTDPPQTFTKCCNGRRIVNITQPVTDPSDPSYGVSCLAYCEVDFARTIDNGTGIGFGDYWDCVSNRTQNWDRKAEEITGQITCGWVNTSRHDQCVNSVSVEQSYYSISTASAAMGNGTTSATATESKTWKSCPADRTASATSSPSSTATGSKSDARLARGEAKRYSIGMGLLMLAFSLLLSA